MVGTIARKEFREMVRDGRFRWAGGTVLLLLLGAVVTGWRSAGEVRAQHEAAARLTRDHWINQPPKNPHSAAHYGVYAFKPKTPLSFADEGVDPYAGISVYLEAHVQNDFANRPAADATSLQRFTALTAANVLQVLVPLLIVVLGAGAIAGEREQGTLRQLLSVGVQPSQLAAGKMLGSGGALLLLLFPAAIVGAAALALTSDLSGSLGRFGLLVPVYLAYFAVWIGLSLAVSAWAPSSRAALVVLLGLWMANTLLAPRAATDLARSLYPTPSALEFQRGLSRDRAVDSIGRTEAQYEEEIEKRVLAQYGVDSVPQLPVSFAGIALDASERWGDAAFDRNYGRLWDTFASQERVRSLAGLVFPFLAVRGASQGLAGTDFHHHRSFATAAERYRRTLVKAMNDEMATHAAGKDFAYVSDVAVWQTVPAFEYQIPPLGFVRRKHAVDFAALGFWAMFALGLGYVAARRVTP